MARTARRQFLNAVIISLFALAFTAFLVAAAYHYAIGTEGVTFKSFAPGVPAFFLFFLARREWRNAITTRQMAARRRAKAASEKEAEAVGPL